MKNKLTTLIDRVKTKLKQRNWHRISAILTLFLLLGISFALYQYYNTIQSPPATDTPQLKINTNSNQYSLLQNQQLKLSAKQKNKNNEQNNQKKQPQSAIKVSSNAPQANFKDLVRPVGGKIVSVCEWYRDSTLDAWKYNPGMDFKAEIGTTVKAVQAGRVSKINKDDFRGTTIIITHNEKYKTKYANLRKSKVKADQQVTRGQVIGEVGDSGSNDENKLHFEIIKEDKTISPAKYFN